MPTNLVHLYDLHSRLVPPNTRPHARYRLAKLVKWLSVNDLEWYQLDLLRYRDALRQTYASATVSNHLDTVRARYRELLDDETTVDVLDKIAGAHLAKVGQADTPQARQSFVETILADLRATIHTMQLADQAEFVFEKGLTTEQASALLAAPGVHTLSGLRDTAILALMLCLGLNPVEVSALDVRYLRLESVQGIALRVPDVSGSDPRLIPYAHLAWVSTIVETWLRSANIARGPIFRSFYRGNRKLRPGRLSARGVGLIVRAYPLLVDERMINVRPRDLRTFARRLYVQDPEDRLEMTFDLELLQNAPVQERLQA